MLVEVPLPEPKAINCLDDGRDDVGEASGKRPELFIKRVLEDVIIDVSNEMNNALLLRAINGVVSGVEVRHQNAVKTIKHVAKEISLSGISMHVVDQRRVCKDPYVPAAFFYLALCLVSVNEAAFPYTLPDPLVGTSAAICCFTFELMQFGAVDTQLKSILKFVSNGTERLVQRNVPVRDP